MNNAELIKALRVPHDWTDVSDCMRYDEWMRDAADALEAAEKRIAELSLDCEVLQQKCMELDAKMPKNGEWIPIDNGDSIYDKCSVCGKNYYGLLTEIEFLEEYHYCPNCGCAMGGEKK